MNEIRFLPLVLYVFLIKLQYVSNSNENTKSKKIIPYFRRQVEEIEDRNLPEAFENDDPRSNLVSFIVNNVKEIFDDVVEKQDTRPIRTDAIVTPTEPITTAIKPIEMFKPNPVLLTSTINATETIGTTVSMYPTRTDVILYENLTLTTLLDNTQTFVGLYGINTKSTSKHKTDSKDTKYVDSIEKKDRVTSVIARAFSNTVYPVNSSESSDVEQDPRRSCIMCDNVSSEDCNDPKNKLIPSVMCEREDDMCYSMHTPFGIIDRGCFNSNHNLTTYVCSCNLCNYISISEMPYLFNHKRDWVDNVIDIARTRHFRNSVFKDMSCLTCEVNTTQQKGDILDSANCLEGHIGTVPVQQCDQNEVCGVKAVRADGYIWRGCIRAPLYNYWWSLCDYDLCNFDSLISLYDFI